MSYCFFSLYWKLLLVVHGTSFLQDCSSGMGHYFFAAILFTVDICHPLHLKTFCSLHRPSPGTNNCDICLSHMKPRRCWRPWSSEHPLREHPFRGQKKIVFASQVGKQLAWLTPGFYGDINTEGHGEFPNAHLRCTDCGENWPFLVLPLCWGENVSGDNCLLWPASSVCAQEQLSGAGGREGVVFCLFALFFAVTKACIFVQLKWID